MVQKNLRRRLEECNHFLKKSKQFVEPFKGLRVRDSNCWIKLDIEGYNMSGNKDDLIADALEMFQSDEKKLLNEVMCLLLGERWDHVQRVP